MTDTLRTPAYLLSTLQSGQPEPSAQTTLLAQAARDLIVSIQPVSFPADNFQFTASPPVISGGVVDPDRKLVAGASATVRFSPVPIGINGTDTAHYIYISGGAGTAEAVLITGGTAVSGGSIGTITFTPANAHSGAWTITSASGGITELTTAYPTTLVQLLATDYNIYAPVSLPATCPGIQGKGYRTRLFFASATADCIILPGGSGYACLLRDFKLFNTTAATAGALIALDAAGTLDLNNVQLGDGTVSCYIGLRCNGVTLSVDGLNVNTSYRGLNLTGCGIKLDRVSVISEKTTANFISGSCALYLAGTIAGAFISSFRYDAGTLEYGICADTALGPVNEVHLTTLYLDNFARYGIRVNGTNPAVHWKVDNFRIQSNAGVGYGDICVYLESGVDNWQFGTGDMGFYYRAVDINGAKNVEFGSDVSIFPTDVGGGVIAFEILNTAGAKNIRFYGTIGSGLGTYPLPAIAFGNNLANLAGLVLRGSVKGADYSHTLQLLGSEVAPDIQIGDGYAKSIASAATLTFPWLNNIDVIELTGNTGPITTVAGLREGQQGLLIATNAAPSGITQGNNIQSPTIANFTRYQVYRWMFTGSKFYIS